MKKKAIAKKTGKGTKTFRAKQRPLATQSPRLVVKRRGHVQQFDERKLFSSIYLACMTTHRSEAESEKIATKVCKTVLRSLPKGTMNSHDLFLKTIRELKKEDEEIAFMYEYHFDIS